MRAIRKYELNVGTTTLQLPSDALPLSVQVQGTGMFLHVLVDAVELCTSVRQFLATQADVATTCELVYIGTVSMRNGMLMLHVFEVLP